MQSCRRAVLGMLLAIAGSGGLQASEFAERIASWQAGGRGQITPVAHEEPAATTAAEVTEADVETVHEPAGPWQQMAFGPGEVHETGACGPDCGGCTSCGHGPFKHCPYPNTGYSTYGQPPGYCDYACETCCGKPIWWTRLELLLWWRKSRELPPLVTTDPVTDDFDTAGILPDATILFGGGAEESQIKGGGRVDIGFWFDDAQCVGLGNRFFGLGRDSARFASDTAETPVLAIPFFDIDADDFDALPVSFPGFRSGSIDIEGSSEILANDVYGRFLVTRDCDSRLDFITGYHFSRINDGLRIGSNSTVTDVGDLSFGTEIDVLDTFDTQNEFHGMIFGLEYQHNCVCYWITGLARISVGNIHQRVDIDGATTITALGDDPLVTEGGLFTATDTNIGVFERDELTAVTELGLTVGYSLRDCVRFTVGYSFVHWNDVVQPGDLIDPNLELGVRPRFRFERDNYWVQGVNLGFACEF